MLKLKREQQKSGQAAPANMAGARFSSARLRVAKDLQDLSLGECCDIQFPNPDDLLSFRVIICPDEGFYEGGRFEFSFFVGPAYPHEPPRVRCDTAVYHPNIDLEGNVCLNILRHEWSPVLTVGSLVCGLLHLFLEPNPEDPLNREAAAMLASDTSLFASTVKHTMLGGMVGGKQFQRCLL